MQLKSTSRWCLFLESLGDGEESRKPPNLILNMVVKTGHKLK